MVTYIVTYQDSSAPCDFHPLQKGQLLMTNLSKSAAPAPAPNLADLITQPRAFFEALGRLPAKPSRYLWLVALATLVGGISTTVLARHLLSAQSSALSGGLAISPLFGYGAAAFATTFISVLLWLLLWGLGTLGAGKEGRAAEVYGAVFFPSLIWAILLLPLGALFAPEITVAAPNLTGLSGLELQKALQPYTQALQASFNSLAISKVSTYVGYAIYLWQFILAFIGFRVLTGNQTKAWRGVLFPAALLAVLVLASYLVSKAVTSLVAG
ncbi:hypothetical protein EHF33_11120 [Deinococcus psychrotolerans]|uniref:Yip1 domain-containing protein n=2 Tax=Deinococcus psychrotolerans TaxID=2489213 RepID=A0A3G8YKW6_9DEIO|nr:hypothetical protein EHF33_11120 [Deinococcus psychrotolerans]